jgi:hypothetical protein
MGMCQQDELQSQLLGLEQGTHLSHYHPSHTKLSEATTQRTTHLLGIRKCRALAGSNAPVASIINKDALRSCLP